MSLLLFFSAAFLCVVAVPASEQLHSIEITNTLPNAPVQCFKSFTGYLPVSGGNKHLFHWYVEATTQPESKPVVLWLNGGPGCSSLGGMFTELGPYVIDKNLNVSLNPYSWNKVANVLFMEQPAGVGFSYPSQPINDSTTAMDTYEGLVAFFAAHPELTGREVFVMGESYGGHYVPNTVKAVLDGNAAGLNPKINLVGFAVGNGYTDWQLDFNANVQNGRFHALTSQALFDDAARKCQGDFARCFWPRSDVVCPAACNEAVTKATENAMDGSIDIYDIYENVCLDAGSDVPVLNQAAVLMQERQRQRQRLAAQQGKEGRRLQGTTISPVFDTCEDNFAAAYLNSASVQAAIGIRPGTVPGGKWSDCGNVKYDFNYESELPNYRSWVSAPGRNLKMLIYNGDADFILSHMGNAAWIDQGLALNISATWAKWRGSDRQVAGFFQQYATAGEHPLTFLTVKGAGHMVPKDRPRHALDMAAQFLSANGNYSGVPVAPELPLCPAY